MSEASSSNGNASSISGGAAKAVPQLVLRFKSPEDYPNVGRFADEEFDFSKISDSKERWDMYYEQEQPREEMTEEDIKKDAEFYRKKRTQRRTYRRKQKLLMEHPSQNVLFEARPVSLDTAEEEFYQKLEKNNRTNEEVAAAASKDAATTQFRNVVLKFVKIEGTDQSEVHVIPVSDMYIFRKMRKQEDLLLTDLDSEYNAQKDRLKKQAARFKQLFAVNNPDENGEGGGRGGRKSKDNGGDGDAFTFAMNKMLSKRKGLKAAKDSSSQPVSYLTESGADLEALKSENDFLGGEYDIQYADDEESHIHIGQSQIVEREELEITEKENRERSDDEQDDDEDDEDAEDEEGGAAGGEGGGKSTGTSTQRVLYEEVAAVQALGTKNVSREMFKEASAWLQHQQQGNNSGSTSSTANAPRSALKRAREEDGESSAGNAGASADIDADSGEVGTSAKRVRFPTDAAATAVSFHTQAPPSAISSVAAALVSSASGISSSSSSSSLVTASQQQVPPQQQQQPQQEYALSSDGVRGYIQHQGGRVPILRLIEVQHHYLFQNIFPQ